MMLLFMEWVCMSIMSISSFSSRPSAVTFWDAALHSLSSLF